MKNITWTLLFLIMGTTSSYAQASCEEIKEYVQSEDSGMTYYSYSSDAISQVTFHEVTDKDYNTLYFAIVKFTSSYTGYIYQVDSNTKFNYSYDYFDSAGKAFWEHIHPYRNVLGCAPDFD